MESPGSPLSDALSDVPPSLSASPEPDGRPTKRQRISTGGGGAAAAAKSSSKAKTSRETVDHLDDMASTNNDAAFPSDIELSEDTEGSISGSVHGLPTGLNDDDDDKTAGGGPREQVSICRWEDCDAGDQGNMDLLVKHLHEEHIHARQKKYSCEWVDCTRKGHPHASGYALRAHMRSHTREKPFYCTLPECDRSFTRSDALAKHMRTVHETEALRPSDPVPKHHSSIPTNKTQRIRLTFNKFSAGLNGTKNDDLYRSNRRKSPDAIEPEDEQAYAADHATWTRNKATGAWLKKLPVDARFTHEEDAELSAQQLYALMKKQIEWAVAERDDLDRQLFAAEKRRKGEWIAKEMVLADALAMAQAAAPPEEEEEAIEDEDLTAILDGDNEDDGDDDVVMEAKDEEEQGDHEGAKVATMDSSPPRPVSAALPPLPYTNPLIDAAPAQAQTNGIATADGA